MKTVTKYLFFIIFMCSCGQTTVERGENNSCFIIGGCNNSYYNIDKILVKVTLELDNRYQLPLTAIQSNLSNRDLIILVPKTHLVCGSVRYLDSAVASNLRFIPLKMDPFKSSISTETDESGKFCTVLPEGSYTLIISPYRADSIPQLRKVINIVEDTNELNIQYPSSDEARYIMGEVLLDTKSQIPVEGINVLAYKDFEDGTRIQSNISTTDSNGIFSLILPSIEDTYSLMIYGSPRNPDWPVIRFEDIITENVFQIGSISLGFVPALRHIQGSEVNRERSRIIANMISDELFYKKVFTTDMEGYFETDLREGRYSFIVIPEDIQNSEYSITTIEGISVPSNGDIAIEIKKKVHLKGNIISQDMKSTPRINIKRLGDCKEGSFDNIGFETSITPDSLLNFDIPVNRGRYIVMFTSDDPQKSLLLSEPLCIESDMELKDLIIPDSCTINISLEDLSDIPVTKIYTELYISDYEEKDFIKIFETYSNNTSVKAKIPSYLCK